DCPLAAGEAAENAPRAGASGTFWGARKSPAVKRGSRSSAWRPLRRIDILLAGNVPQFRHDAHVELPHPLPGDTELLADLFQRHAFGVTVQSGPHTDDLPLARIQILQ